MAVTRWHLPFGTYVLQQECLLLLVVIIPLPWSSLFAASSVFLTDRTYASANFAVRTLAEWLRERDLAIYVSSIATVYIFWRCLKLACIRHSSTLHRLGNVLWFRLGPGFKVNCQPNPSEEMICNNDSSVSDSLLHLASTEDSWGWGSQKPVLVLQF